MPETKIILDKDGQVTGAEGVEHDASHQIIEEFMLAANVAVATQLADKDISFLRRVHPNPDEAKLRGFAEFVESLGFKLKLFQSKEHQQRLLNSVKDTPLMRAVNYALLRSMKQAVYSPEELGHYALSEKYYCHFTSPIRRYPDLTIHRIIDRLVTGDKRHEDPLELVSLGSQCSFNERRAEKAERELIKVKLLTFLEDQVGLEFDAVITGVQKFGFFCQGIELPAEGLVHISTLAEDFYDFEAESHCIVGRRSGKQYRLGDIVHVGVAHVDVDRRELDFRVVTETTEKNEKTKQPKTRSKPKESRGSKKKATGKKTAVPKKKSAKKGTRGPAKNVKKKTTRRKTAQTKKTPPTKKKRGKKRRN